MKSPTRRTFLKTTAALAAALPVVRLPLHAGASPAPTTGSEDAGLLFAPSELPRIRASLEHPRLAKVRSTLRGLDVEEESRWLREDLRLNNHVADFMRVWKLVQNAAFAHVVWEEPKHLQLALLALSRMCDYRRWDYFLEAGRYTIGLQRASEATIAACYALDWLGERIPAELKARVEDRIVNEGAPACYRTLYGMKYPDRVRGWGFDPEDDFPQAFRVSLKRWPLILNSTNLKIIPTCGLGLAAAWFHGRHPDARKWLDLSRQSARSFATMYGEDGSYDEGVGYWGYTTCHLAMVAEALHRRLGIDDRRLINYPGTIRYGLAMSMPAAGASIVDPQLKTTYNATPKFSYEPALDTVNFCDAGAPLDASVAAWVGKVHEDPISTHVAAEVGVLAQLQAAVWFRPEAPRQQPGSELHDTRLSIDWVVSRTGWKPEDTVLALRSGGPSNHEHADRNSVILKAHGERLFHDPFRAGYSPSLPRWLLRLTEAHSAVLIDGRGHQYHDGSEGTNASWAEASVRDFRTGPEWMLVTSDATSAYALVHPDAKRVTRTLAFLKPDVLLVLDRVELGAPAAVQVRYQVFNDDLAGRTEAGEATFRISRPLASLEATVAARGACVVRAARLPLPEAEGVFPFVEIASAAALSHTILTVASTAPAGVPHGRVAVEAVDGGWLVAGQHRGRTIRATLKIDGDQPRLIL